MKVYIDCPWMRTRHTAKLHGCCLDELNKNRAGREYNFAKIPRYIDGHEMDKETETLLSEFEEENES